ncbi:MAG TPA: hypothetical protein DDX92_06610 [Flavobacteriales bacterium]|jgi:hypothetical protein|nr:hypothetical protein [Flavobacteriales bacterium]
MTKLLQFLAILTTGLLILASCTKEGPQGAPGEDGTDGMDGADGTAGCIQCHDDNEDMKIISHEWALSGHVNGGHMGGFYGARDGCTDCHSSQGFQLAVIGSWDNPGPDRPLPANCYTCHKIHETYTPQDWSFRVAEGGINFLVNNENTDQGSSNSCVVCHQSRTSSPTFDPGSGEDVSITNRRYGPHHGPQGNMMAGVGKSGAYEISGSLAYANSEHATNSSCVSCHMADGAGSSGDFELGGHSKNVAVGSWDDGSRVINANGCIDCHASYPDNDAITGFVQGARDNNILLIDELKQLLLDAGYIDNDGYVINDSVWVSGDNPLVVPSDHAAAIYNYKFVTEDQSFLIHNPNYAKALVTNSIEVLE